MRPSLFLALMGAGCAMAHHMVTNIYIDGTNQGAGTCMRIPPNTSPLTDLKSSEMACNVAGSKKVAITCAANAGSTVTVQWRTWPDGSKDTPIDGSHQGPCAVYMKRMENGGASSVAGGGWFKIWHDGFKNGEFCTERLRKNGNKMTVPIPQDLASGYYTFRAEQLALHQAKSPGGAQWYVGCAQLFLYSTGGNAKPTVTVSIPGYVSVNHPGVLYDYWGNTKPSNYQIPGPEPYIKTNTGGGDSIKVPFTPHNYKECLVKNANWCGVSPPKYTNEATCWESAQNCWDQLDICYATAPATGNKGCDTWNDKCDKYKELCSKCGYKSCSASFHKFKRYHAGHPRIGRITV